MTLRISDLEKNPNAGSVWVVNNTRGSNRSLIVLSVPKANGQGADNVRVPVTFVPVDLTGQVPKAQLLSSSDFRRAVSSLYLTLLDEDSALRILEQPGAREELERLAEENNSLQSASVAMTNGAQTEQAAEPQLSPRVNQFLVVLEESSNAVATLNTLRAMGELNEAEYRAISELAGKKRGFEALVAHCEESLAG